MKRFCFACLVLLLSVLCACTHQNALSPSDDPGSVMDAEEAAPLPENPPEEEQPNLSENCAPPPLTDLTDDTFVRVQDYLPDVQVSLRYATEDNFTGTAIYDFSDAYLRCGTVKKLADVTALLSDDGYTLLIWDAFRPTSAQFKLWEVCPDSRYVANPTKGFSSHSRGNTLDVTLIRLDGSAVEMPTDFDDFSPLADRDYSDVSETAAENAQYFETVFIHCGFKPYSGEWWHFSDTDPYPVEETFIPAS